MLIYTVNVYESEVDEIMEFLNTIYNFFFDFENKESFNAAQDLNVFIVGFVLVLAALILLSLIVSLLPKLLALGKKKEKKDSVVVKAEIKLPEEVEVKEEDDEELIAVLTAAIMSYYGNETKCNLKVTSFKRIDNAPSTWSNAGKRDNLDASL